MAPRLAALALAAAGTCAQAAGPDSAAPTGATPQDNMGARTTARPGRSAHNPRASSPDESLTHAERTFMETAAQAGTYEVNASQVAETKAIDPAVKDFAHKLLQDHRRANGELLRIAKRRNMKLPDSPDWHQRRELARMGRLAGPDFDRSFVQHAVKDHEAAIRKFQQALGGLDDRELESWAARTLGVLRTHLAMARALPEAAQVSKQRPPTSASSR